MDIGMDIDLGKHHAGIHTAPTGYPATHCTHWYVCVVPFYFPL